jgi:hypothetical protein
MLSLACAVLLILDVVLGRWPTAPGKPGKKMPGKPGKKRRRP